MHGTFCIWPTNTNAPRCIVWSKSLLSKLAHEYYWSPTGLQLILIWKCCPVYFLESLFHQFRTCHLQRQSSFPKSNRSNTRILCYPHTESTIVFASASVFIVQVQTPLGARNKASQWRNLASAANSECVKDQFGAVTIRIWIHGIICNDACTVRSIQGWRLASATKGGDSGTVWTSSSASSSSHASKSLSWSNQWLLLGHCSLLFNISIIYRRRGCSSVLCLIELLTG